MKPTAITDQFGYNASNLIPPKNLDAGVTNQPQPQPLKPPETAPPTPSNLTSNAEKFGSPKLAQTGASAEALGTDLDAGARATKTPAPAIKAPSIPSMEALSKGAISSAAIGTSIASEYAPKIYDQGIALARKSGAITWHHAWWIQRAGTCGLARDFNGSACCYSARHDYFDVRCVPRCGCVDEKR